MLKAFLPDKGPTSFDQPEAADEAAAIFMKDWGDYIKAIYRGAETVGVMRAGSTGVTFLGRSHYGHVMIIQSLCDTLLVLSRQVLITSSEDKYWATANSNANGFATKVFVSKSKPDGRDTKAIELARQGGAAIIYWNEIENEARPGSKHHQSGANPPTLFCGNKRKRRQVPTAPPHSAINSRKNLVSGLQQHHGRQRKRIKLYKR